MLIGSAKSSAEQGTVHFVYGKTFDDMLDLGEKWERAHGVKPSVCTPLCDSNWNPVYPNVSSIAPKPVAWIRKLETHCIQSSGIHRNLVLRRQGI